MFSAKLFHFLICVLHFLENLFTCFYFYSIAILPKPFADKGLGKLKKFFTVFSLFEPNAQKVKIYEDIILYWVARFL